MLIFAITVLSSTICFAGEPIVLQLLISEVWVCWHKLSATYGSRKERQVLGGLGRKNATIIRFRERLCETVHYSFHLYAVVALLNFTLRCVTRYTRVLIKRTVCTSLRKKFCSKHTHTQAESNQIRAIDVSIRLADPTLQKMKLEYKWESQGGIVKGQSHFGGCSCHNWRLLIQYYVF